MTLRDCYLQDAGSNATMSQMSSSEANFCRENCYLIPISTVTTAPVYKYKNRGWYVAGGVEESWVTVGAPSTVPPSGHTLIGIDYVVLQP